MVVSKSVQRRWNAQMPLLHERGFTIELIEQPDVVSYVAWEQIKELMSEDEFERFSIWMSGQTSVSHGCYPHDLERFLEGKSSFRF